MTYSPPCRIIITRPRAQLDHLVSLVGHFTSLLGVSIPVTGLSLLEIVPNTELGLKEQLIEGLENSNWVTFSSPNAFLVANDMLLANQLEWPTHLRVAVVGGGTAQVIEDSRFKPKEILFPQNDNEWDSSGLLSAMQSHVSSWEGQKIMIIKGQGGRDELAKSFQERGISYSELAIYRRTPLALTDPAWLNIIKLYQEDQVNVVHQKPTWVWVFTSSESIKNLSKSILDLQISESILKQSVAIVTHQRVADSAQALGMREVHLAQAGDVGITTKLIQILLK